MNHNNRVYEKLSIEFNRFMDSVKQLPGEEAIKYAYEKVFKENILSCFEKGGMNLSPKQATALLAKKRPLDFLYESWNCSDYYSYMGMLKDCISDSISCLQECRNIFLIW